MRTLRIFAFCLSVSVALSGTCSALFVHDAAAAAPSSSLTATPQALASAGDEKQRVPRPRPEPPRYKPDEKRASSSSSSDDDEEGDFFTQCLGSILEGCLTGICESMFQHEATPHAIGANALAPAPEPYAWLANEHGWLRATSSADSVSLWVQPYGADSSDAEAGRLPDDAEVVVTEVHPSANGVELRVRPVDGVEPSGFVSGAVISTSRRSAGPPLATPAEVEPVLATPRPRMPIPKWAVRIVGGPTLFAKRDLAREYDEHDDTVWMTEAFLLGFKSRHHLMSGFGVSWWTGRGIPDVDYVSGSLTERPVRSRWDVTVLDVVMGQRFADPNGFRFDWSVGPAAYYVHESAEVQVYDAAMTPIGAARHESLTRWTGGGVVRTGVGWQTLPWLEMGLRTEYHVMAWTGHRQRALTSDFTGGPIPAWGLSLALTYTQR